MQQGYILKQQKKRKEFRWPGIKALSNAWKTAGLATTAVKTVDKQLRHK